MKQQNKQKSNQKIEEEELIDNLYSVGGGPFANLLTLWRLFNLCTNDFVKIQKIGKINKILGKGNNEEDDKCSTYFLPETVSEDWTGKGQFILKHFKSGKYICFGRKEGLQVRDICSNLNKIRRNRRAEEGNKQKQLRETALKALLARIEASEENVIEENI
uniref:Uncharacterized protein n=1 Tax=Meloidogyne floridensis TaxID=298350 RepID=A0A915NVA8_9BILA